MIELLLQAERELSVGMVDQAERLFSQVLQADPRNGIAIVGLARVALERGDEREAYQLARRTLALDPENAAAQRLVARFAEVFAHRGEELPADLPSETSALSDLPGETSASSDLPSQTPASSDKAPARGLLNRLLGRR